MAQNHKSKQRDWFSLMGYTELLQVIKTNDILKEKMKADEFLVKILKSFSEAIFAIKNKNKLIKKVPHLIDAVQQCDIYCPLIEKGNK